MRLCILLWLVLTSFTLQAFEHLAEIGPQCYYMKRMKDGGTHQSGTLYGLRASYERIKPSGFYGGLFFDYGSGPLSGQTASARALKSNFTDLEGQLLLGYTFSANPKNSCTFTPFLGVGYLEQINNFVDPSPITARFKESIEYYSFGFLSQHQISKLWNIGLRITVKEMWEGKCFIYDKNSSEHFKQIIENKTQLAVDIPIVYHIFGQCSRFSLTLMPFYQFRHYGGHLNYPSDYIDTMFNVAGARLLLDIRF